MLTSVFRNLSAFMSTRFRSRLLLLCGFAVSIVCGSHAAQEPTETTLAERLGAMGCQVELTVLEGKVSVSSVHARGRITKDLMKTEPLSVELFSFLKQLHRLRKLCLTVNGGELDRTHLKAIGALQSVRELDLNGRDVTDGIMPYVCSLTNLESLRLGDTSIGEEGLARLPELKMLKRLDLFNTHRVLRRDIEAIAKLHELEFLGILGEIEDGALPELAALRKLGTVSIGGPKINTLLAELKAVASIQRVELSRADIDATTVQNLRGIRNLHYLKLVCCRLTAGAIASMKQLHLSGLECVQIDGKEMSELLKGWTEAYGNLDISH